MINILEEIILKAQKENNDPCTSDADIRYFETKSFKEETKKLSAHIEKFNASPVNVEFGYKVATDIEHWLGYGIYTVEQFDFYMTQQDAYEVIAEAFSKSYARIVCFGEGVTLESISIEEKTAREYLKRLQQEEENQEAEIFAEVNSLAKQCNVSHETMERWLAQAV